VPESPAFKILGTSPSNIMRPASVRDISVSVGNYLLNNSGTIPQNMAVEVSPSLFNPHVSLQDFQKARLWYTSALSLGTKVNADKSYAIGLGVKFRLIDHQDLRLNETFLAQISEIGQEINAAYSNAINTVTREHMKNDTSKKYHEWRVIVENAYSQPQTATDSVLQKEVNSYIDKVSNPAKIITLRDQAKTTSWNKTIWDIGGAILFNSKDSFLRDIQPAAKIGVWTTLGLPLGPKGQLLIGLTGLLWDTLHTHLNVGSLNIGSRAFYGSNDLKGYIEGNGLFQTILPPTYKASIGIETTFFGGLWLDFSLGISKQGDAKAIFTPGFNLFFGNSEKKKTGT
jgi:hypothetical protein